MQTFKYTALSVVIPLSSAAALAGTGTGTAEITATPRWHSTARLLKSGRRYG